MVVDWIKRWLPQKSNSIELSTIPRDEHRVSRKDINHTALKVLYRLQNAGYEGYLVGGCVRDLQLGLKPKDFDVATDATPEQVRKLFSNSRLIGRRFRIVHVTFGREIIEVTTFRGRTDDNNDNHLQKQSDEGLLLRDNVYGSLEEDAERRDFTVNALYYTPKDFTLKAYGSGMDDLENKVLRIIGDPETRYREDPVRMMRAVRFAAKLGFSIEPRTGDLIPELAPLLSNVAAARLFDEVIKMLMSGQGLATWRLMREYNLVEPLLPATHAALKASTDGYYDAFIEQALVNTDDRINRGKPVTPAFLYAALLWPPVREEAEHSINMGTPEQPAWLQAMGKIVAHQISSIAIPKRFSIPMKEIWELQLRLPKRTPKRAEQVASHPRFRAAYDFLLLRESAGEKTGNLGQWWTDYQTENPDIRRDMASEAASDRPRRRRRRRPPQNRGEPTS
ncbi:polynucleotide adenylyltransferase PcnB [Saccharospirillum impatiens]|uniref:polynucleotide adenylyltransferase PcnB n=1 Tax=Saccharospirillum impatiens TaxID=169438 RepID=UPI0003FB0007|nr:polynucleotide adenylyltransferase PcnB [Saccharospirillum impatiens]